MLTETKPTAEEILADFRNTYSDFYKEAFGVRPRRDTSSWTVEQFEQEWKILGEICQQNAEMEAKAEARAIDDVEKRIAKLLVLGAKDRAAAIRWLHEAEGTEDSEYLCYCLGLPYGYFKKEAP